MRTTVILWILLCATAAAADDAPMVNYVSADGVYINVGRYAGVVVGAQITVIRDGKKIAVLEVVHVSSHSASCRVLEKSVEPRAGDPIQYAARKQKPVEEVPEPAVSKVAPSVETKASRSDRNRVRGYVALQNLWLRDMSGSELSTLQPAIGARLVISNVMGTGGTFSLRQRSRLYYRPALDEGVWTHRLTEFALRFGNPRRGLTWGVGRMVVDDVHGLGYIDGAFATMRISSHYRAGVVAGLAPNTNDGSVRPGSSKFGTFLTWEGGSRSASRLALTAALSGSYVDGIIDREFGYLQAVYGYRSRFHAYGSVEVDLNRKWREEANGGQVSFSNFLSTITATPTPFLSLDFTWDARQSVHDYNTFDTPDSLFDDNFYSGYNGGVTLSRSHLQLRVNGGIRLRETSEQTNRYYTITGTARQFPMRGHILMVRWAVSQTPFVTGYRPTATLRFPLGRKLRMNAGLGAYHYEQGIANTRTYFGELGAYYTFGRRYYLSGDFRQFAGGTLESFQLFTEIGVNF